MDAIAARMEELKNAKTEESIWVRAARRYEEKKAAEEYLASL